MNYLLVKSNLTGYKMVEVTAGLKGSKQFTVSKKRVFKHKELN